MKKLIFIFALFTVVKTASAQDKQQIERACLNYIEGFYRTIENKSSVKYIFIDNARKE